jgi:hypothetical protein
MSEFLDELARSLVRPMPRSRALRLVGGALVSAATAGVLGRSAPSARAGRRAAQACPTDTCGYRPILFVCADHGTSDPGPPCGPPDVVPNCCKGSEKCCSDGPPGGNFPGRCTGSSEVSREGFYCCPASCDCYKGICCAPGSVRAVDKTGFPICCDRGETLCDQPQALGGVICCKKVCGPDVTDALKNVLSRTKAAFAGWSSTQQFVACDSLLSVAGVVGWEINQLGPGNREQGAKNFQPECATCGGSLSVQVGSGCHYAGSVNYVVYGVMLRLCHDHLKDSLLGVDWFSKDRMNQYITIYKTVRGAPNLTASLAWANAGYDGWPSGPTPPPELPNCAKCSKQLTSPLTVRWLPIDRNI